MKPIFFLGWLWKLFGFSDSKIKKSREIAENIKKCEQKLKTQQNLLKDLKRTIADTQEEILLKEKERDSQTGQIREITEQEILSLFNTFKTNNEKRDLIFRNINTLQMVIAKYQQLQIAIDSDVDSDELEALTMDLMDSVKELQYQDRELKRLEVVGYSPVRPEAVDVDAKLAEIHATTSKVAPTANTAQEPVLPQLDTPQQTTLPKFNMPEPQQQTMPTSSEVDALLRQLHQDAVPAQKAAPTQNTTPTQLEE